LEGSGIWYGFIPGVEPGATYKYHLRSRYAGYEVDKADPLAFCSELPPATASRVWRLDYEWHDDEWLASRAARNALDAPMSIYELHVGSWRRAADGRFLTYRELAPLLVEHVQR